MTRALLYARCSTSEQDFTRQLEELRADAARLGWIVVGELGSYVSGGENAADLNDLFSRAHRHRFDRLLVWELSRLTRRGVGPLLAILARFEREGVRVWSHSEAWLETEGPAHDVLVAIFGWVAKWERDAISARTKSALASRKVLGVRLGRPRKYEFDPETVRTLRDHLHSWSEIARRLGLPKGALPSLRRCVKSGPPEPQSGTKARAKGPFSSREER